MLSALKSCGVNFNFSMTHFFVYKTKKVRYIKINNDENNNNNTKETTMTKENTKTENMINPDNHKAVNVAILGILQQKTFKKQLAAFLTNFTVAQLKARVQYMAEADNSFAPKGLKKKADFVTVISEYEIANYKIATTPKTETPAKPKAKGLGRKEQILKVLKNGPSTMNELANKLGISNRNVSSILTYLRHEGHDIVTAREGKETTVTLS